MLNVQFKAEILNLVFSK